MFFPAAVILLAFSRSFNNKTLTKWVSPYWDYVAELDKFSCINEDVRNDTGFVMEDCIIKDIEDTLTENISIWDLHCDTEFD